MMWYYGGGWNWLWMSGMMVVFWGAVILLAIWAFRALARPANSSDSAIETLRRRLAAGEISPEEFEKTKRLLAP